MTQFILHYLEEIKFDIIPYIQYSKDANVQLLDSNYFDSNLSYINSVINDDSKLKDVINSYYNKCDYSIKSVLEPIQNRYIHAAQNKKILPSLVTKKWLLQLANIVKCESHYDKLLHFLSNKI